MTLLATVTPVRADVVLSVTSATVTEPGEVTQICVLMDDGGEAVAGTQNDLVWDGNCATIEEPANFSCKANSRHGKQLNAAFPPGTSFTLRAFVLSLADTDPINETELYCCSIRSELTEPGSSCVVNLTRVGASTPKGEALSTRSAGQARITFAGSGRDRPRPGAVRPSGPVSAVGGNTDGPGQAGNSAPAADTAGDAVAGFVQPTPVVVQGGGQVPGATDGSAAVDGGGSEGAIRGADVPQVGAGVVGDGTANVVQVPLGAPQPSAGLPLGTPAAANPAQEPPPAAPPSPAAPQTTPGEASPEAARRAAPGSEGASSEPTTTVITEPTAKATEAPIAVDGESNGGDQTSPGNGGWFAAALLLAFLAMVIWLRTRRGNNRVASQEPRSED